MSDALDQLARAYGIEPSYISERGGQCIASEASKRGLLQALGVPSANDEEVEASLASAPQLDPNDTTISVEARCFMPHWLVEGRSWGITCQLYGLRSDRNWGIGDFDDLAQLAELGASAGADFVGVNPLHALFLAEPARYSPYAPSSRSFLNPLYISIEKLAPAREVDEVRLEAVRASDLVDYCEVTRLKREALWHIYQDFVVSRGKTKTSFEAFCATRGNALRLFALYEALSEQLVAKGHTVGWHGWPPQYRNFESDAVKRFQQENEGRVSFHMWLQWLAETQLKEAQDRAKAAGMRIGLYLDLAVGVVPDGAATWSEGEAVITQARLGCPPDMFNEAGQDWGLAAFSPLALVARDFEPFEVVLDELIRCAGAIRIDHAMSLMRVFLIPANAEARDGAYVRYPLADMLRVLSAVSQKRRTIIIGEDLGIVPDGFREVMHEAEIQGYRVFYFEREANGWFSEPNAYSHRALACLSTHDLATLKGWWCGSDIDERERLGWLSEESARELRAGRSQDRVFFLAALKHANVLPPSFDAVLQGASPYPEELPEEICAAAHAMLAKTSSRLVAVQLEDLAGAREQANLPGSVNEHPNWRRKLQCGLAELAKTKLFHDVSRAVSRERPKTA
jgi:4-alpha-glucanotransferase